MIHLVALIQILRSKIFGWFQNYNEESIPLTDTELENVRLYIGSDTDEEDDNDEFRPNVIDVSPGVDYASSDPGGAPGLYDVEKLFEKAPRFDIQDLTSGSEVVISEQVSDNPVIVEDSRLYRDEDFSSKLIIMTHLLGRHCQGKLILIHSISLI